MTAFSISSPIRWLCALAGALLISSTAFAQNKVVFQVSDGDPAKWNLALGNVHNLQKGLGGPDKADVEIVAYGPGVNMLKADSPVAQRIAEAIGDHVRVVACKNTMAAMKLNESDMLPNVAFVPSGVVEVMQKQQQGYAYIRP